MRVREIEREREREIVWRVGEKIGVFSWEQGRREK